MTEKCVKREQLSTIKVVPQSLTRVPSVRLTLDLRVLLREGESRRSGPRRRAEQDHDHLERQQADGAAGTFSYRHFPSKNPSLLFTLSFFYLLLLFFFFLSFFSVRGWSTPGWALVQNSVRAHQLHVCAVSSSGRSGAERLWP